MPPSLLHECIELRPLERNGRAFGIVLVVSVVAV
jgi:hypothetical protein